MESTQLTVTKGLYGYMVVQVWLVTDEDGNVIDVPHQERLGGDFRYQFDTPEEAIANFESWRGDNWEDTPRSWKQQSKAQSATP